MKPPGMLKALLVILPLLLGCILFLRYLPGFVQTSDDGALIFLAYGWTGIFLHEAGHAMAGKLMGFRMSVFRVVPIEVARREGNMRWSWHTKISGGYLGIPQDESNLPLRTAIITAGGPAANLITFLLCWYLLSEQALTGAAFGYARGLMIFSLFSAVLNLAPLDFGASKTDGWRILEAVRQQASADRLKMSPKIARVLEATWH